MTDRLMLIRELYGTNKCTVWAEYRACLMYKQVLHKVTIAHYTVIASLCISLLVTYVQLGKGRIFHFILFCPRILFIATKQRCL